MTWLESIARIEEFEDVRLDAGLVADFEAAAAGSPARPIRFSTPTFKDYASTELKGCSKNSFPSFSITAGACGLNCDHCRAEILKPMLAATSPAMLDQKVRHLVATQNLQGFLLSGGSNRRNEIPYERYYPVVEQLKRDFPEMKIAIHTALTDERGARAMESAGVDTAMMDVIGARRDDPRRLSPRPPGGGLRGDARRVVLDVDGSQPAHRDRPALRPHPRRDERARHRAAATRSRRWCWSWSCPSMPSRDSTRCRTPATSAGFSSRRAGGSPTGRCCSAARGRPACTSGSTDAYAVMAGLDGIAFPADGAVAVANAIGRPLPPGARVLLDQDRGRARRASRTCAA